MSTSLAVVSLGSATGQNADKVVNTFVIDDPFTDAPEEAVAIGNAFIGLYNDVHTNQIIPIAAALSPVLSRSAGMCSVGLYDISDHLDGSPHGSPYYETTFTLEGAAGTATPLPSEVAYVMTLEALGREGAPVEAPDDADPDAAPERPKQRRTGRNYWGPLTNLDVAISSGVARPAQYLRDTVIFGMVGLRNDLKDISVTMDLAVWSREDAEVWSVVYISADDAFDTQRRRGEKATLRGRWHIADGTDA